MAEAAVEERAAAKINLDLFVLGRRPDGLHELDSVVVFADLADRLVLRSAPGGEVPEVVVDGPEAAEVPRDDTNLVLRAARVQV